MGCYSRNQAQHKLLKSVYTQVDLLFMYVFRQQLEMTAQFSPQHHSHIAFPVAYHTSVFVLVFWKFEGRGNILNNPVSRTWYNLRKLFLEIRVVSTLFWPVGIRGSDQQAYAEAREVQSGSKEKLFHHEGSQTLEQSAQGKLCLSFLLKILHINIQRDSLEMPQLICDQQGTCRVEEVRVLCLQAPTWNWGRRGNAGGWS